MNVNSVKHDKVAKFSEKKNARDLRSALTLREWPMIRTASSLFTFSSTDHHKVGVVVKVILIMKNICTS